MHDIFCHGDFITKSIHHQPPPPPFFFISCLLPSPPSFYGRGDTIKVYNATKLTIYHRQQNNCYPQKCLLAISKLHSILAIANLLVHNNISQICYCGQISLQSAAVNCSFSDNLISLGVTFILLALVHCPALR